MRDDLLRIARQLRAEHHRLAADVEALAARVSVDPRPGLTKQQRRVLDAITVHLKDRGSLPTYQQIAESLGLRSLATIGEHIDTLEHKGYLRRTEHNRPSTIVILPAPTEATCAA